jgi:hypothetical protein
MKKELALVYFRAEGLAVFQGKKHKSYLLEQE